mmetsp:Transcript_7884/g.16129  ORF Transcript_7884/g.16129 Transcript_7884/m.16129 type:complete len:281 (+) Transcript_7884:1126-1968(+)
MNICVNGNNFDSVRMGSNHVVRVDSIIFNHNTVVPIGNFNVIVRIPIGITQAFLQNLHLGGSERAIRSRKITKRSRTDIIEHPSVINVRRVGKDFHSNSLAPLSKVIYRLSNHLGVNTHGHSSRRYTNSRTRSIQIFVKLNLTKLAWIANESESVFNALVSIDDILRTLNRWDYTVGQFQESLLDSITMRLCSSVNDTIACDWDALCNEVLTRRVPKSNGIFAPESICIARLNSNRSVCDASRSIINVQRINSMHACAFGTVSSGVSRITLASHRGVFVP